MVQAFIFDCDGTLVETEHLKFLAWQYVLKEYGIEYTLGEHVETVLELSVNRVKNLSKKHGKELPLSIIDEKNVRYKEIRSAGVREVPGVVEFIKELSQRKDELGIKLGVASSDSKEHVLANINDIGLDGMFDAVVSDKEDLVGIKDPDGVKKPKPYIYQHIAKVLGANVSSCVVFEDSPTGVQAASEAGMVVIAVPSDMTKGLGFSQADFVLKSLEGVSVDEVIELVRGLCE